MLKREVFNLDRPSRRAVSMLWRVLCNPKTALQLLCLISHQRQHTVFCADEGHVKLISNFHDKCQHVMVQLIDFLAHPNGCQATAVFASKWRPKLT